MTYPQEQLKYKDVVNGIYDEEDDADSEGDQIQMLDNQSRANHAVKELTDDDGELLVVFERYR